jgi:hypothetical protein
VNESPHKETWGIVKFSFTDYSKGVVILILRGVTRPTRLVEMLGKFHQRLILRSLSERGQMQRNGGTNGVVNYVLIQSF